MDGRRIVCPWTRRILGSPIGDPVAAESASLRMESRQLRNLVRSERRSCQTRLHVLETYNRAGSRILSVAARNDAITASLQA